MPSDSVVLWQMPPAWGLPNPSPFCMKVETWLRMAGIPYEAKAIQGPPKSGTRKVPYIERPGGTLLSDSSVIIDTLARERGVTLDEGVTTEERALSLVLQRTLEESLYFCVLYERWVDDAGWAMTEPAYFETIPWFVRRAIVPIVRRQIISASKAQGLGRLPKSEIHARGVADVNAVAGLLGDKPFFLGRPSTIDATAYAFIENLLVPPIPSPVSDAARKQLNLVRFAERMKQDYWQGWRAPD
jgi:glutathione S-transferase